MSRSSLPFLREPSMPGMNGNMAASPMAAPLPGVPRFFHIQGGHSFGDSSYKHILIMLFKSAALTKGAMRSTEYMSMTINNQEDFYRVQRLVWGKLFGLFIQKGREKRGCMVEEVARLAGME